MADWTGDTNSVFKTLGASNHTEKEREGMDYYATDPRAVGMLLDMEPFDRDVPVWECAAGGRHLSRVLEERGYVVRSSDIVARVPGVETCDFLTATAWDGNIITNPPYSRAAAFVGKALEIVPEGRKVAMFLKLQFLEGKARRRLFDTCPPRTVWVSSSRLSCARNGDFAGMASSAVAYAWYVWVKGYEGFPVLRWFN